MLENPLNQLALILHPFGIKTVTTGVGEVEAFFQRRYGTTEAPSIEEAFKKNLEKIATARVLILGVPNDNGAGFDRGSKKGPLGIRNQWLEEPELYSQWETQGIVDIGDVRDHPLLIDDQLLQNWVIEKVQKDRWGNQWEQVKQWKLPVSPHSILERALDCISLLNPTAKVLLLGGDHSKSLIPVQVLSRRLHSIQEPLGILQFDAHTDLLQTRDGVDISYATWSWHANEVIGRNKRLVQIGVRTSARSKKEWEEELDLCQYWAHEVQERGEDEIIEEVIAHFQSIGIRSIYLSNDIDGLDPSYAACTGTVEKNGLTPEFETKLIARIAQEFHLVGADLVEVAPTLSRGVSGEPMRTLQISARLARQQIDALLKSQTPFA